MGHKLDSIEAANKKRAAGRDKPRPAGQVNAGAQAWQRASDQEWLGRFPRDKPTPERLTHSRMSWSEDGWTVKVTDQMPDCVLRMRAAGTLSNAQVKAAECLIRDHMLGYESGIGAIRLEPRVDGGGAEPGDVEDAVLDARTRYACAKAKCPAPIWEVVKGVLIDGAHLTVAGSYTKRFSSAQSRQKSAATILGVGLLILSEAYGLT